MTGIPEIAVTTYTLWDRTLPDSGAAAGGEDGFNALNIVFIVGMALVITVLARYLAGKGRRK